MTALRSLAPRTCRTNCGFLPCTRFHLTSCEARGEARRSDFEWGLSDSATNPTLVQPHPTICRRHFPGLLFSIDDQMVKQRESTEPISPFSQLSLPTLAIVRLPNTHRFPDSSRVVQGQLRFTYRCLQSCQVILRLHTINSAHSRRRREATQRPQIETKRNESVL